MDIRPKHHITAEKNWINDPNGLIKFRGRYHVFFQYHPYSLKWGPMHWGHVVSDDLLHWEHLPIALTPGDEFDKDGCFSGTAIIHNDRLYVIYTGFIFNENPEKIIQQQCLAYSDDGINFTKVGLIIGEDNLPKEFAPNDFRDPCVYKDGDDFVMLVAARRKGGTGNILKYVSKDLIHWEYVSYILEKDSDGIMIECPDYIKELGVLIRCEQINKNYPNLECSLYSIGEFEDNKFIHTGDQNLDYGFDYYAPQVILDGNYLIAWMNMWDRNNPSEQYGFAGMFTIPRKLEVIDGRLHQTPVHPDHEEVVSVNESSYEEHVKVGFYKIELEDLEEFSLKCRSSEKEWTSYELNGDEFIFDRSHSGEKITGKEEDSDSLNGIRRMPLIKQKKHTIYVVLDEFSVELFLDGFSLSSQIFPSSNSDLLQVKIKAKHSKITRFE